MNDHNQFLIEKLSLNNEVQLQQLKSKKNKQNIYTFLRSKQGYGNECNIVAFPLNYKASISTALTLIETWNKVQPKWQAKDLIVLFYEDMDYALSIQEFLQSYYHQSTTGHDQLFMSQIQGRCGYIRQAFPIVIKEYQYNKVTLIIDGFNSKVSDIDFYDVSKEILTKEGWNIDYTLPLYFRNNEQLNNVINYASTYIRETYLTSLELILNLFDQRVNQKGALMPLLEAIKNKFIGKVHQPHSHFIDYGIHSITYSFYNDAKQKQILEKERVLKTMGSIELMLRSNDQLDEQLHAGFYFFILTSKSNFVSISVFVYPVAIIIFSYFIYAVFEFYEIEDRSSLPTALVFVSTTYALGFLITYIPKLFMGINEQKSSFCLANEKIQTEGTYFILEAIALVALSHLIWFKLFQKRGQKNLYLWVKQVNLFINFFVTGALIVYQFPLALLNTIFIFPILYNMTYLFRNLLQVLLSFVLISSIGYISVVFLFGSLNMNVGENGLEVLLYYMKSLILDYECVGSNIWLFICCILVPNIIVSIKVLLN